jgi:hypothetical protein
MSAAVVAAETAALCVTAGSVGAVHTLLGPDHYVVIRACGVLVQLGL